MSRRKETIIMAINFKSINLEIIDLNTNATPDIYINQNCITFSKRVLEDLNYPQNVQYCLDAANKIFDIRVCKANDAKATPFSKPKSEQTTTLSCGSKNLREVVVTMITNYNAKMRYKITGEYDSENRVMYFDMATAEESFYRNNADKEE
jgi:hypothetical protein